MGTSVARHLISSIEHWAHLLLPELGEALTLRARLGQQLGVGHVQAQPPRQDAEAEVCVPQGLPVTINLQPRPSSVCYVPASLVQLCPGEICEATSTILSPQARQDTTWRQH